MAILKDILDFAEYGVYGQLAKSIVVISIFMEPAEAPGQRLAGRRTHVKRSCCSKSGKSEKPKANALKAVSRPWYDTSIQNKNDQENR